MCVCLYIYIYIWSIYFIHLHIDNIDRPLSCFCILVIVNNTSMKIGIHISLWLSVFVFFSRLILRSGIVGLYGSYIFNILWRLHTVFYDGFITLHSHHQCTSVFFSSALLFCLVIAMVWYSISLWFCLHFSEWVVVLNTFTCACWPSIYLPWIMSYNSLT